MITTREVDQKWKSWLERKLQDENQNSDQEKKNEDSKELMQKVDTDEAFANFPDQGGCTCNYKYR